MNGERNYIDSPHLVLCFQVHQPKRLTGYSTTDSAPTADSMDKEIFQRIARECYLPTNFLLLRLIEQYPNIRLSFSISGLALEQMEAYAPEALESFQKLAATGSVDFVAEPYYHSLAFLLDSDEFEIQVLQHVEKTIQHFGIRPSVLKNTALVYNDDIGRRIHMMGFEGVLTEGCERSLRQNQPQNLYEHRDSNGLKILLRNRNLSDDIAFRAGKSYWNVTADKFLSWLDMMPEGEKLVTLCVDYETFGEHNKPDSGIFAFLENLLLMLAIQNTYRMVTPSEVVHRFHAHRQLSIPDYVAVAGTDLAKWIGNDRQREALAALVALESVVKRKADPHLLELWKLLQAADHFYYMSDEAEGPECLSPYPSPRQAYDSYMACIRYINQQISDVAPHEDAEKRNELMEAERRNIETPLWALRLESHTGPVT
ncbi:MAG TPA: glycoside hydrolase family 57 protein [Chryseosolibacter sp.]